MRVLVRVEHELDSLFDAGMHLSVSLLLCKDSLQDCIKVNPEDGIYKVKLHILRYKVIILYVLDYLLYEVHIRIDYRLPGFCPRFLKRWVVISWLSMKHLLEEYFRLVECELLLLGNQLCLCRILLLYLGLLFLSVDGLAGLAPLLSSLCLEGDCPAVGSGACQCHDCIVVVGLKFKSTVVLGADLLY